MAVSRKAIIVLAAIPALFSLGLAQEGRLSHLASASLASPAFVANALTDHIVPAPNAFDIGFHSRRLALNGSGGVGLEPQSEERSASGRVFSDMGQKPLAALVQIVSEDGGNIGAPAQADEDGAFALDGLDAIGGLRAKAYLPGYTTAYSDAFSLEEGSMKGIVLYLEKEKVSPEYALEYFDGGAAGGEVPDTPKKYPLAYSATVLGNLGNLAKPGYAFVGWRSSSDMKIYKPGETIAISSDTYLTAAWSDKLQLSLASSDQSGGGEWQEEGEAASGEWLGGFQASLSVESIDSGVSKDSPADPGEDDGEPEESPVKAQSGGGASDKAALGEKESNSNPRTGDGSKIEAITGALVAAASFAFIVTKRRSRKSKGETKQKGTFTGK